MKASPIPGHARGQLSLKWFLIFSFLALGCVLVVGYSWLSVQFFIRGMDNIVASNMERAAERYLNDVPLDQREAPSLFSGYHITLNWERMPPEIQAAFPEPPEAQCLLYKQHRSRWLEHPDIIHFAMRLERQGHTLFIAKTVSAATSPKIIGRNAARSMHTLIIISILIVATLGLIIWLLLRRISRPVAALGRWTGALDPQRLREPPPDFSYPELNALAELIRTSLSSVQESLEREHRFLRHASHELRTPIAVIRSNLELLSRLRETSENPVDIRQSQVLERMNRASLNMQHLTETLLWLSREGREAPSSHPVRLDALVEELVEEMRYLLNEKRVCICLDTHPYNLSIPEVPARIVLGNLIRNAFQHTWDGRVSIRQQEGRIEILNSRPESQEETQQSLGFGLGLQLTAQLTERLGWGYVNEAGSGGHRVVLKLRGEKETAHPVANGQHSIDSTVPGAETSE
ncbi:sensor histidine kinase [Rhabdochromatium marinum]|uniref:sensor histidine kinase n=1 Tax=Rhabdochromatium marinum TaxID=48729 RepID=UPI001906ECAE|nr:HAMP domain-containing sensor histidine kinase [Rhabdochromatium marinum]MBK1649716.1 histidine kinase [Rhabdochromatium marinum]